MTRGRGGSGAEVSEFQNNDDLDLTNLEIVIAGPLDFPFTCKEVQKDISKPKNNKQLGLDFLNY